MNFISLRETGHQRGNRNILPLLSCCLVAGFSMQAMAEDAADCNGGDAEACQRLLASLADTDASASEKRACLNDLIALYKQQSLLCKDTNANGKNCFDQTNKRKAQILASPACKVAFGQ